MSDNNESYENIRMDPEQVEELCEAVRQKDLIILDLDRQIEWYNNVIAEAERNYAETEQRRKEIQEENRELDKQYEQLQFISKSAENACEMEQMALSAFHALEAYTAEEEKTLKLQALKQKEQLDNNYMEAEKKMTDNPLYKELEQDRAKALIADMETRQLQMAICTRNSIMAKEQEIKKIIMDQYCLVQQMEENLERLKAEENEKMKKLLKLQEGEKMGLVKMIHVAHETGSQDIQIEHVANTSGMMSEPVLQQTKENDWDTSKLHRLHLILEEQAPKKIVAPHVMPEKVRISNQKIIVPATVSSPEPERVERRKIREMDSSKNYWLKKKTSLNVSQESEGNASLEMSPDTSQESQSSLKDRFMKHSTPQNISLFKKPMPVQAPQLSKQDQIQLVDTDGSQMMMTGYSSQASPPTFGSQLVSTAGSQITPQSILTSSKDPSGFNDTQPKSVRFNLERSPSPFNMTIEKPKFMGNDFSKRVQLRDSLGEGHENPFNMFSIGNASTRYNYNNDLEQPSSFNSSLNLSFPEAEDEDTGGMELNNSGNENNINGGEVPSTGSAGGFFSFNLQGPQGFKFPFE